MAIKFLQRLPHLFLQLVRIDRLFFELSIFNLQNVIYARKGGDFLLINKVSSIVR